MVSHVKFARMHYHSLHKHTKNVPGEMQSTEKGSRDNKPINSRTWNFCIIMTFNHSFSMVLDSGIHFIFAINSIIAKMFDVDRVVRRIFLYLDECVNCAFSLKCEYVRSFAANNNNKNETNKHPEEFHIHLGWVVSVYISNTIPARTKWYTPSMMMTDDDGYAIFQWK